MIRESDLTSLLFFDLETSGDYPTLKDLKKDDPRKAAIWETKQTKAKVKDPIRWDSPDKSYEDQSPLSPEFGRIVCASFCNIVTNDSTGEIVYKGRMKSYYDTKCTRDSESTEILQPVSELLNNVARTGKNFKLCGHNIKKFDIPFLAKRLIMKGISVPYSLQTWGKKPWEIEHVDTGELWAMGAWDNYASLDLMSCSLGVPSSKDTMHGEFVGMEFWKNKDYEKIRIYCEEDVKCVARICHKLSEATAALNF